MSCLGSAAKSMVDSELAAQVFGLCEFMARIWISLVRTLKRPKTAGLMHKTWQFSSMYDECR